MSHRQSGDEIEDELGCGAGFEAGGSRQDLRPGVGQNGPIEYRMIAVGGVATDEDSDRAAPFRLLEAAPDKGRVTACRPCLNL